MKINVRGLNFVKPHAIITPEIPNTPDTDPSRENLNMKNLTKTFIAAAIAATCFNSAFAAQAVSRDVGDVIVAATGKVTVRVSGGAVNPAACQNTAYVIEDGEVSKKEWLAQLLTAKAAGFKVTLSIDDNVCVNDGKNPKINNIIVV